MSLNDDLIQLLGQVARGQGGIRLLNVYKGLPLIYETKIQTVAALEIRVPASRQHIACLYHQRETFLQGDKLPFLIRSQVISLNLAKDDVVLSHFEVAKPTIGKRSQIRVEPENPLVAFIQFISSGYELPVTLVDISSEGASLYLETHLFPIRQFRLGNEFMISISFPDTVSQKLRTLPENRVTKPFLHLPNWQDGKVSITAQGKVAGVFPELHLDRYRIGLRLYFQDLARMVIVQYVSQRQSEIIRDLHILSDELYLKKK